MNTFYIASYWGKKGKEKAVPHLFDTLEQARLYATTMKLPSPHFLKLTHSTKTKEQLETALFSSVEKESLDV